MLATAPPAFVPTDYEWLRLRFEADRRSRARGLLARVQEHVAGRPRIKVLDLGAGAGGNLLFLAPQLPVTDQEWVLVDRDGALLARVAACCAALGGDYPPTVVALDRVPACCAALGGDYPSSAPGHLRVGERAVRYRALVGDFVTDARVFAERWDLVVANAVFDLLPERTVAHFFEGVRSTFAESCPPLYLTIHLDTGLTFDPESPEDEPVRALFHAHMRRPQAFGRALGPQSARALARLAARTGFTVHAEPSPWRLGPDDARMLHAKLDFIENAVTEMLREAGRGALPLAFGIDALARWVAARRAQVERGELRITVGHRDLWLTPHPRALAN